MNEYVKNNLYRYYGKDDCLTLIRGYLRNKTKLSNLLCK